MPLIDPVTVNFGELGNKDLDCFVYNNIMSLQAAYANLHDNLVPKWRRLAKGVPKDKTRNWPWPGASNTVIQLIGENIDILKAIQIGSIYEVMPIWVAGLVGEWKDDEQGEEQREVYETFMDLMALSKEELDLYRVESLAANDIAEYGMVVIKCPWITKTEAIVTGVDRDDNTSTQHEEKTIYDGPRPEKLNIQDWAATPTAPTWSEARFKYHGPYKLSKDEIRHKIHKGQFDDNEQTRTVLSQPDRQGLDTATEEQLKLSNVDGSNPNEMTAEWDFYECWFWYDHNNVRYRIIYTYHLQTKTRMKAVYNFYADNEEPFEFGRLGYTDDGLIGYGFAEMGEMYQEQVATQHNQRNDHGTLQNTSIILTGRSSGLRLDSGFSITPMSCLPFNPDEFDIKQLGGATAFSNIDDENLTIALAKSRFGTDVGLPSGSGSGVSGKGGKGGPSYSSQGTFSIMQTGARRININVTDFRYMHLGLGNKCGRQYSSFGIGERYKLFGEAGPVLRKALESIKSKRMWLPIKAATASINREVEKQTGMLFVQTMERHFSTVTQIIQGISNPMMKDMPEMREYLIGCISAQAYVMGKLIRAFGYDNVSQMQPEVNFVKSIRSQQKNGQRGVEATAGSNGQGGPKSGVQEATGPQVGNNGPNANNGVQPNTGIL